MDPANIRLIRLICQNHLTAGGTRNSIQVERFLQQHDDREIAQTLYKHDPLYVPGKIKSYCTADELEPFFAQLRADFPNWMRRAER